ncbi:hypothetical protein [Arthrobacter sp.]|uniref:hypothetical protein n=1 Tax=Arthrobacter sp. TaxID=1667 RepID=UPI003A8F58C1
MTSMDLLTGPRGRRFCLEAVTALSDELWSRHLAAAWEPHNTGLRREFGAAVASEATRAAISRAPAGDLLTALARTVDHAAYWQPPDEVDELARTPEVLQALEPIARELGRRITGSWWSSPVDTGGQRAIQWIDGHNLPAPQPTGAAAKLAGWRERTLASERMAATWSRSLKRRTASSWWSTPALSDLVQTTRALPGLGSAGLLLVEDGAGWNRARIWPLAPTAGSRILEIREPADWVGLVERQPLEVTQTWRKTAYESTGLDATWLIPDFAAVAQEYDGVHLTAAGYLATAGRPLESGRGLTLLAGWDPDATYWLTDVLEASGEPTEWENPVEGAIAEWAPTRR